MTGLYALTIIMVVYAIGDMIATKTKAVISMLFVASVLFAVMFWVGLPSTLFSDSSLSTFASVTVGILLVHMGTTINLRQLASEWKTVVIVFCSTVAICVGVYYIGGIFINQYYALIGAPILGGGVVAYMTMSAALESIGDSTIALFGSLVLILQGVVGFPIASFLVKKEGKRVQAEYKAGNITLANPIQKADGETKGKFQIFPKTPDAYNGANYIIAKLAIIASIALYLSGLTGVNQLVICLILGVVAREIGFLDEGSLTKANGFTFVIGAVLTNVFSSLANTTPATILSMVSSLLVVLVVGLACCAVVAILVGKIFGQSWYMSFALGVTALFGFPGTLIVPTEVAKSLATSEEEQKVLLQELVPRMIIAGMVSVSIVSVVAAGVMTALV